MESPGDQSDPQAIMPSPALATKLHEVLAESHTTLGREQVFQIVKGYFWELLLGRGNEKELQEYKDIYLREQNKALSDAVRSSTILNLEDNSGDPTDVQPTNEFGKSLLDFVNRLMACLSASPVNGSGISLLLATQALTRCIFHLENAITSPHAPGSFWHTGDELCNAGRNQITQDVILPCIAETPSGEMGLKASQDTGSPVSFTSKKASETLEAKIVRLPSEGRLIPVNGAALVATHKAIIKIRLPCRLEAIQVEFFIVDELPEIQAYLCTDDALRLNHILLLHCEECARAMR